MSLKFNFLKYWESGEIERFGNPACNHSSQFFRTEKKMKFIVFQIIIICLFYILKQHGKQTAHDPIVTVKSCQYFGPDHCGTFSSLNFCKQLLTYRFILHQFIHYFFNNTKMNRLVILCVSVLYCPYFAFLFYWQN
jgi:hypothetical protein